MRGWPAWLHGRKTLASILALAVIAGVPIGVAAFHRGFPVNEVNLDSRDVWVTNGQKLLGGRLDSQIGELDAAVSGSSAHLDVLQDGGATLLTDTSQGIVDVVDPAFVSLVDRIQIPVGSQLAYGADTLAILGPTGKLWVIDASGHLDFDAAKTHAVADLGSDAQVVVSKSGSAFAVSPSKRLLYTVDAPGADPRTAAFPRLGKYQLSAVGDQPVALDTAKNRIVKADGSTLQLAGTALRIQQPGEQNAYVLVATGDGLDEVPLGGGKTTQVSAKISSPVTSADEVSAPVWLNGCAYGAWSGAERYLYACDGRAPTAVSIEQPVSGDALEFRVNHQVIALNNLRDGNAWIVSSNMQLVQNWAQVKPDDTVTKQGTSGEKKPVQQSFAQTLAKRTPHNRPPVAVDDAFGVRPGRTTVLQVLSNDSDPDGDVLTISEKPDIPSSQGRLDLIDGGRSLQFTPAAAATGTISFRYSVDDGRGGTASAAVNATIRPLSLNAAPVSTRTSTTQTEIGQSIAYNVLSDWIDPDGDDIYLVGAASTTGDAVQFSPDGQVTFTSKTGQSGSKEVTFTVSDGHATASGSLLVTVRPQGSLDPVAVPDSVTGFVAKPVVIHPLDNDTSPSGNTLRLASASLDASSAGTVTVDADRGVVTFHTATAGTYYLKYTETAGSSSTTGLIRVDISPGVNGNPPPIAVKDVGYLRAGESTTVNVLDNDVSPSGAVLAVQSVDTAGLKGQLSVELLGNAAIRVSSSAALTQETQFDYTISDGATTSTAGVTIVPVPPLVTHQTPVAANDQVTVRAGDIATVSVLDNDYSPDGATLSVDPTLVETSKAGGLVFVTGNTVRYQAPTKPGQYSAVYRVKDDAGETAAATVIFTVLAADQATDRAPVPTPLTARAFADSTTQIDVPLDGIDPDGDSVSLSGITDAPKLGRIVTTNSTSFTYQAYPGSTGTDTFSYQVADPYGKTAIGTVSMGVIPRPANALPPNAVDDKAEVKPGRTASIPVLGNDSDPNGYAITLTPKLGSVDAGITAKTDGNRIVVTAPKTAGTYSVGYQITNGHGGADTAFLQVVVTKNAVVAPPSAIDHVVPLASVRKSKTVTVTVLDNAQNPGGLVSDLKVELLGAGADTAQVQSNGTVHVHPTAKRQAIAFRLTDEIDRLSAMAFIVVPAAGDLAQHTSAQPPYLKKLPKQLVPMNGSKTWKLADLVVVPSGKPVQIISAQATNGNGDPVKASAQTLSFTAKKDYRGPASVSFLVSDAAGPNDSSGTQALLTIPITVGDPDFQDSPPVFTPPHVTIEAGNDPIAVDLRASSSHPNPAVVSQLSYTGFTNPSKTITASLSGSNVSISAPFGVPSGTTTTLKFSVRYKDFVVPGSVAVTVVSSTKPLTQAVDDAKETTRGKSVTANVLANDTNPFAAKGQPLRLVEVSLENAATGAAVSYTPNGNVTVTAGTAFIGDVSVVYTVEDATKDKARRVQGRFIVTVSDVPSQPAAPTIASEGDRSVNVHIATTARNGKDITGYTVSGSGVSSQQCSPGADCIFSGLDNGVGYTFTVVATNADGPSETSAPSATAIPYGAPSAPASANIASTSDGSQKLTMSWAAPADTGGRALDHYEWQFVQGKSGSGTVGASTTSRGDTAPVGTAVQFQIRACGPGGCSGWTTSNSAKNAAPPAWQPTHHAAQVTNNTCPEPDSTYQHPPTNVSQGCTMSPYSYLPPGTQIDVICYSQRNGDPWFNFGTAKAPNGGWYIRQPDTSQSRSGIPDC